MSQNTLKVHDLNEDAEFDENGVEVFDEKALVEEEPSDNDLAEEEIWPKRNCYRREPHSVCWTRLSFTLVRLVIHHC
ncbi:RNA polymerase sigma factor RpoS [Escherichia coli]|uniref:RNA polymerase sigma factor RpoS n=1 Tax=Escherichia coli TaxID=562 RepID=A0A376MHZ7_ECOLX|nr:RNA polymerase sigma factor RpoS [Escherichia coli]